MITDRDVKKWLVSQRYTSWRRRLEPIFYLPGSRQNLTYSCTASCKKPLLLSPINYIVKSANPPYDYEHLKAEAKHEIDIIDPELTIKVDLDGAAQTGWERATSKEFFTHLGQHLFIDGYWVLLTLDKGRHTINSLGACRSGSIQIRASYEIKCI